jgi:hypothetical protein
MFDFLQVDIRLRIELTSEQIGTKRPSHVTTSAFGNFQEEICEADEVWALGVEQGVATRTLEQHPVACRGHTTPQTELLSEPRLHRAVIVAAAPGATVVDEGPHADKADYGSTIH